MPFAVLFLLFPVIKLRFYGLQRHRVTHLESYNATETLVPSDLVLDIRVMIMAIRGPGASYTLQPKQPQSREKSPALWGSREAEHYCKLNRFVSCPCQSVIIFSFGTSLVVSFKGFKRLCFSCCCLY